MSRLKVNKRELILCPSTAHYLYAKAMQQALPREIRPAVNVDLCICQSNVFSRLRQDAVRRLSMARQEKAPFDVIWLFFDRGLADIPSQLIEQHDIRLAYAPVCLEKWFLLHFEEDSGNYEDTQASTNALRCFWPAYARNQVDAYGELLSRLPAAKQRANAIAASAGDGMIAGINNNLPLYTIQKLIEYYEQLSLAA